MGKQRASSARVGEHHDRRRLDGRTLGALVLGLWAASCATEVVVAGALDTHCHA